MLLRPHVPIASSPRYDRRWNTSSMRQEGQRTPISRVKLPRPPSLLPAILTVRRHWLPVTTRKRAIVIPDIADAPIDIREGCPLFPSIGNTADGHQGAVFHSHVGAACAIGSLWRRLGMGGLEQQRAGDQ